MITNNYEFIRNPYEIDEDADYFLLTDSKEIKSDIYNVIYLNEFDTNKLTGIQKNFIIKYSFYKYIPNLSNYDYMIFIDGSIQIFKKLSPIINYMRNCKYDLSIAPHPIRNNVIDEYDCWIEHRKLNPFFKKLFLNSIKNYDYENIKGLCETSIKIFKNSKEILNFIDDIHSFMSITCNNEDLNDQCYFTYILYNYKDKLRINFHPAKLYRNSEYMKMFIHNSNEQQLFINTAYKENDFIEFFDKKIKINSINNYK